MFVCQLHSSIAGLGPPETAGSRAHVKTGSEFWFEALVGDGSALLFGFPSVLKMLDDSNDSSAAYLAEVSGSYLSK